MTQPATFAKNAWYVAATPEELDGEKPLGRRICGLPMVFFRGPEGQASAVDDFCPHRGAPLSLGRVIEGKLVCGYHGLEMGCDGKTLAMPGQRVRGFPPIRSFPVIEKHGFVWVWLQPGAQPDTDPFPLPLRSDRRYTTVVRELAAPAGNGGFRRGRPFLPSRLSIIAVSSPQI